MLEQSNLMYFLVAIMPAIIYSFVIYINMPYKSIKLNQAIKFLIIGLISAVYVIAFNFIFPNWSKMIGTGVVASLVMAFIQVALIEEVSKYISFKTSEKIGEIKMYPVEIMFYSCMISMGFALFENVYYLIRQYYEIKPLFGTPFQTIADSSIVVLLKVRSVTAIVAHMITGIIMGYFISLGRQNTKIDNKSFINIYFKRNTKIKRAVYSFFGIFFAVIFHGIYDANLMIPENQHAKYFLIVIIGIGLLICYLMSKKLINATNKMMNR